MPKVSSVLPPRQRKYPAWICHDCGIKYCNGLSDRVATYHLDDCGCCGAEEVPCTEPRDYGHLKEWPLPRDIDPKPLPVKIEDLIDGIIENFDFEKVHSVMTFLDWWWLGGSGPGHVPTVEQLREKAHNLLLQAVKEKEYDQVETGGLVVIRSIKNKDPLDDGLQLLFVLERYEAYLGDFE